MNKITLILSLALLGLSGCRNMDKHVNQEFKKGAGDMLYVIHEDQEGETIQEDDFVGLTYTEKTEEDSVINNSNDYDGRMALMFRERSYFPGDLFAALGMLSEGDSATFKINLDSIVAHQGRPRSNTKGKYLIYTVRINKVVSRGKLNDSLYSAAIDHFKEDQNNLAKSLEASKFSNYISSIHLKPAVTASGLNYIIATRGTGPTAVWGDTVEVNYTAMYLSEKVFETSYPEVAKKAGIYNKSRQYGPVKLLMTKSQLVSGFDEALLMFPKGSKYRLIIPSRLAYGENGNNNTKPYTSLLCDVELANVIHPEAPKDVN